MYPLLLRIVARVSQNIRHRCKIAAERVRQQGDFFAAQAERDSLTFLCGHLPSTFEALINSDLLTLKAKRFPSSS